MTNSTNPTRVTPARALGWFTVVELEPTGDGERRWRRFRLAAWAVVNGDIVGLIPDGSAPRLRTADGWLVHELDLRRCMCATPDLDVVWDPTWCARCAGTVAT
jgi:hypothetical protein